MTKTRMTVDSASNSVITTTATIVGRLLLRRRTLGRGSSDRLAEGAADGGVGATAGGATDATLGTDMAGAAVIGEVVAATGCAS